jgi:peroxiredoxin
MRAQRFAIIVQDGVAREVDIEAPREFKVSTAEHILSRL